MAKENTSGSKKSVVLSLEEQTFLAVMRTADWLQRQATELLKQYDLSPVQYNALRILRGAGPEGLPCSEIGHRMISRDPDITRLMGRLEKRGLVQRCREKADRRVIKARITPQGLGLLSRMDPEIDEFQRQLLGHMGMKKLKSLMRLLAASRAAGGAES